MFPLLLAVVPQTHAQAVNATKSGLIAPATHEAGELATLLIHLRDQFGDPLADLPSSMHFAVLSDMPICLEFSPYFQALLAESGISRACSAFETGREAGLADSAAFQGSDSESWDANDIGIHTIRYNETTAGNYSVAVHIAANGGLERLNPANMIGGSPVLVQVLPTRATARTSSFELPQRHAMLIAESNYLSSGGSGRRQLSERSTLSVRVEEESSSESDSFSESGSWVVLDAVMAAAAFEPESSHSGSDSGSWEEMLQESSVADVAYTISGEVHFAIDEVPQATEYHSFSLNFMVALADSLSGVRAEDIVVTQISAGSIVVGYRISLTQLESVSAATLSLADLQSRPHALVVAGVPATAFADVVLTTNSPAPDLVRAGHRVFLLLYPRDRFGNPTALDDIHFEAWMQHIGGSGQAAIAFESQAHAATEAVFTRTPVDDSARNYTLSSNPLAVGSYSLHVKLYGEYLLGLPVAGLHIAALPPIEIVRAHFLNSGNGLRIQFDRKTNRARMPSVGDCAPVIPQTDSFVGWFGLGPLCQWTDDETLIIYFGAYSGLSMLQPGNVIALDGDRLLSVDENTKPCVCSADIEFLEHPPTPVLVSNAPTQVSSCDAATIDISESWNGAGRPMAVFWSGYARLMDDTANVSMRSAANVSAAAIAAGMNGFSVSFFSSLMWSDTVYVFTATLRNFLGGESVGEIRLSRVQDPILRLSINGPDSIVSSISNELHLSTLVHTPPCAELLMITYEWTARSEMGALDLPSIAHGSHTKSNLFVAPDVLLPGQTYTFTVQARSVFSALTTTTATVNVEAVCEKLPVSIDGGNSTVQFDRAILLKLATPVDSPSELHIESIEWLCAIIPTTRTGGAESCPIATQEALDHAVNNHTLNFEPAHFGVGKRVQITASMNGTHCGRPINKTVSTYLEITNIALQIMISRYGPKIRAASDKIVLDGYAAEEVENIPIEYSWQIVSGEISSDVNISSFQTMQANQVSRIEFPSGSLFAGQQYTFRLHGRSGNASGWADAVVETALPPLSGSFDVYSDMQLVEERGAIKGNNVLSTVILSAQHWVDMGASDLLHMPLIYTFYFAHGCGLFAQDRALLTQSQSPLVTVSIPAGVPSTNYESMLTVEVTDHRKSFSLRSICVSSAEPLDCAGSWSAWTNCTAVCGGGTQQRAYNVSVLPIHGGVSCPVDSPQTQSCNVHPCPLPVQCGGNWSTWSNCTKYCDNGTQARTFHVSVLPRHGGTACPESPQSRPCNVHPCHESDAGLADANAYISTLQIVIAQIWKELLNLEASARIESDANYFSLGGAATTDMVEMLYLTQFRIGLIDALSPDEFVRNPTLGSLVDIVAERQETSNGTRCDIHRYWRARASALALGERWGLNSVAFGTDGTADATVNMSGTPLAGTNETQPENAFDGCDRSEGGSLQFYAAMRGNPFPKSCAAILQSGYSTTGQYLIDPDGPGGIEAFAAFCDMDSDGGGWVSICISNTFPCS
eukprot:SAG31_NODE_2137_length_6359_cov_83.985144_1_plen_1489_part_00